MRLLKSSGKLARQIHDGNEEDGGEGRREGLSEED
jgi:hypothetical protein